MNPPLEVRNAEFNGARWGRQMNADEHKFIKLQAYGCYGKEMIDMESILCSK